MGGPTLPFCFGRIDDEDGTASLELGPAPEQAAAVPCHEQGNCTEPLGTTTVGLIYLNPEGPMGRPDPAASAKEVRAAFARMGMNDTQTIALIGGGHAFGKTHGACPDGPGVSPLLDAQNPWPGACGTGLGANTFTSGFEGPWTTKPTQWDNEFFKVLVENEWEKHVGPGGHWQWRTTNRDGPYSGVMRLTSDLSLLHDPAFLEISKSFAKDQSKLDEAFAQAWDQLINAGAVYSLEKKCYTSKSVVA
jgi:catalase (peroxidase I)